MWFGALWMVSGLVDVIALGAADRVGDSELVERARAGDAWATETIYRRYVRLVAATAHRLLRSDDEVDDIVQETFLIAFERLDQLVEGNAIRGWLVRIAISRVHRRFRWRRWTRLWSATELEASLHDQASADASPEQRAELALIDRALGKMALKLRVPWVLRHVVGLPLEEVAIACDCSLATAKRRIADADHVVAEHVEVRDE
ncbi:MAG: sigma-70 family RNA polymerase sigma factor [Kofleriaceae bacterium]